MKQITQTKVRVSQGGRIVIPASIRECLNMNVGEEVLVTVKGNHATLMNTKAARQKAQERVCRYIPPNVDLAKELMAERKAEAKHE